ncbi:ISAs1 family transposase [Polymorphospora lycopeni]|uniref:ISAs1 family transposase n=1 Tax=Polymorphospora lycopeni TaxID=3140240 RepID=A0ABV5D0W6_9ACTN
MPALASALTSSLSCAPALTVPDPAGGLPAVLAGLPDPRARRGVRHRLAVVVTAAVCAVVAAYRSYAAIAEWVADVPAATALTLGMTPNRRPSEAMIRRLLQAMDPQLSAAISVWLARRAAAATSTTGRAIAVDGKGLRGSRSTDNTARHVLAACDQNTGVVLGSIDVNGKSNEITRFQPLLDQISDPRDTVITADALHCQREPVTYLAERGAHWILTVKGNQPHLHAQLTALPGLDQVDDRGQDGPVISPPFSTTLQPERRGGINGCVACQKSSGAQEDVDDLLRTLRALRVRAAIGSPGHGPPIPFGRCR